MDVASAVGGERVRVPAHFDAEVVSGVRRALSLGLVPLTEAAAAIRATVEFEAERAAISDLVTQAFALRDRFSTGDSFYFLVALDSGATLVTCDRGQARAAEGLVGVTFIDR